MNHTLRATLATLVLLAAIGPLAAQSAKPADSIYHPPVGKTRSVALLLLGGSEGGLPDYYDTKGLTKKGYACLIAGYFGTQGTPERLEMLPLEYFEKVLTAFRSKPEVGDKKIVVWGGSKGGELALLLASRFPQIRGVIAVVPSSVAFQGLGGQRTSSWSHRGEPVSYVPFPDYDYSKIVNAQYVEVYRLALEQSEAVKEAIIPVERINGPVLVLTGKADTMWPSSQMGAMIEARLNEKKFPHWHRHFSYADAGHTLNDGYLMGGTPDGNRQAKEDARRQIDEFLERLSAP